MHTHSLGIELQPGISRRNLFCYFIIVIISSGYAGLLAMLEPPLLQLLAVPFEQQGSLTGNLRVIQELVYIVLLGVFGVLADRLGRRPVYFFGLVLTALGYCLYPFAQSIAELVAYRLIIATGGAAVIGMMVTVIADYSSNRTRGKANGWQGLMATLGAFIPPLLGFAPRWFVGYGLDERQALQATFLLAGLLGLAGAALAWWGLARLRPVATAGKESLAQMLGAGLRSARQPRIALAYGAAFISRGDLAITGAFMGLWLVQYAVANLAMTPSEAMWQISAPRVLLTVLGALIGSMLMGYISDKISRVRAVTLAAGFAACVYMALVFISDPTGPAVMVLMLLMGIAEISAFVSSQALVGQEADSNRRGAVIGFFGVAGAFGILLASGVGGWVFDHIGPSSPFVMFGALNLLVCLWSLWVPAEQANPDTAATGN